MPDAVKLIDWQVRALRAVSFPASVAPTDDQCWWEVLVGDKPTAKLTEPRTGSQKVEGPFQDKILINQTQPGRIDWILVPRPPEVNKFPVPLGPLADAVEPFKQLILRWLCMDTCPQARRLAFMASLEFSVASRENGYTLLSHYIPAVTLDAKASSDFLYRINRPRPSATPVVNLQVNRLSTWAVNLGQWVSIQAQLPSEVHAITGPQELACNLELDVNTVPNPEITIPTTHLPPVFSELVDFALEIANMGDTP